MKHFQIIIALAGLFAAAALSIQLGALAGLAALTLLGLAMNRPSASLRAVTLSVPEILKDFLPAFKLETPELFSPAGFGTDFSSNTAVLGDKITARISHVPVTGAYDPANGGFRAAAQDVETLIEDVPVTLNQLRLVTVNINWLTQLSSKVPLYKEAIANMAYALGKYVVDTVLATAATSVSNSLNLGPAAVVNLDTWDGVIRNQCNSQKMQPAKRYAYVSSPLAAQLGLDDRVRSSLFYGMLNGDEGYRIWNNIAGFAWIKEYQDIVNAGIAGLMGDRRLAAVAVRRIRDISRVAEELHVPKVMEFHRVNDPESGLELTGASWQDQGSGNLYLSVAALFGVGVGNQGGAAGTMTDSAGCILHAS